MCPPLYVVFVGFLGVAFAHFNSIKSSNKRKSQPVPPFSDVLYKVKRGDIKQKVILIQKAIFLFLFPSGDMVKAPHKESGRIYCIIDALLWLWLDCKSSLGGRGTVFVWLPRFQVFFLLERHLELLKAFQRFDPFCLLSCLTNSSHRTIRFVTQMLKLNSVRPHMSVFPSLPPQQEVILMGTNLKARQPQQKTMNQPSRCF